MYLILHLLILGLEQDLLYLEAEINVWNNITQVKFPSEPRKDEIDEIEEDENNKHAK